mmetsp:Transcript_13697/g.40864  ORF Transcript_13697/g.40864 Transcript_13697/m.40864 type:complete len:200 (-) Transcript_13697:173-772(-)
MLRARQPIVQRVRLRHDAQMARRAPKVVEDRRAFDRRVARARERRAHDDRDGRRLARAVRAEQTEDLARVHAQAQILDRDRLRPARLAVVDFADAREHQRVRSGRALRVRTFAFRDDVVVQRVYFRLGEGRFDLFDLERGRRHVEAIGAHEEDDSLDGRDDPAARRRRVPRRVLGEVGRDPRELQHEAAVRRAQRQPPE